MTRKNLMDCIHKEMCKIWREVIPDDYRNGWFLKEDTLKNALYFYLRSRLGAIFEQNDVRIFTEFTDGPLKGTQKCADLVIAKVDFKRQCRYYGEAVSDILAIVEIKHKRGYAAAQDIYADYDKMAYYAENLGNDCRLYMASIWENEDEETPWMNRNAAWASGRLTELNASYDKREGEMRFYVFDHSNRKARK